MNPSRWQQLTLVEQMGNIGSAYARAVKTRNYDEVFELLDLTISDKRWIRGLRELTRLREVVCDQMVGTKNYQIDSAALNAYFLSFAVAARH